MTSDASPSEHAEHAEHAEQGENRLRAPFDGALHLLDRQIVDVEGRMTGKVDDVELTEIDGRLVITALLTGPAALLDRVGGRAGAWLVDRWSRLRPIEPHRARPWRIEMARVARLASAVHLDVRRQSIALRDREELRLGRLTGMRLVDERGGHHGRVIDVRFVPDERGRPVLDSLVVGRGGPGSYLGYERRTERGPWVVRRLILLLHRDTSRVGVDAVRIDWSDDVVRLLPTSAWQEAARRPVGHPFPGTAGE